MKKLYIYLTIFVILMLIGSCVVFAAGKVNEYTYNSDVSAPVISDIPSTAITFEDSQMDDIYKNAGTYFENIEKVYVQVTNENNMSGENNIYERRITDEKAIEIAKNHISGALSNYNSNPTVEFLLYSNIHRGIEQRPVLTVTFDDVMVGRSSNDKLNTVETKILIDSLTGEIISLISAGHN